jgi:hypothetical protein
VLPQIVASGDLDATAKTTGPRRVWGVDINTNETGRVRFARNRELFATKLILSSTLDTAFCSAGPSFEAGRAVWELGVAWLRWLAVRQLSPQAVVSSAAPRPRAEGTTRTHSHRLRARGFTAQQCLACFPPPPQQPLLRRGTLPTCEGTALTIRRLGKPLEGGWLSQR